jgi:hypothetical protein
VSLRSSFNMCYVLTTSLHSWFFGIYMRHMSSCELRDLLEEGDEGIYEMKASTNT